MMTKPMLIEALKPGMRAKIYGVNVFHDGEIIRDEISKTPLWSNRLSSTEYEIIADDPKPWSPSLNDYGWFVDRCNGREVRADGVLKYAALRTKQAAKHKAKLDRMATAILNMPGFDENSVDYPHAYYNIDKNCVHLCFDIKFNSFQQAKDAANYANKLIEDMDK